MSLRRNMKMTELSEKYFTCPYCGLTIAFNFIEQENIYRAKCPFCESVLEMSKEEFETTDTEYYFEKE